MFLRTRHLLLVALATLAATPAGALGAKPAGPALTLQSKTCNTGVDPDARSIVLSVSSALANPNVSALQLRFAVQTRLSYSARWANVVAAPETGLGVWLTSSPGAQVFNWNKTIEGLDQGVQYRVRVDARGVNGLGIAATRVARTRFTCVEPQISPKVTFANLAWRGAPTADAGGTLVYTLLNKGRTTAPATTLVLTDPATGAEVARAATDNTLPYGKKLKGFTSAPCSVTISIYLTADVGLPGTLPMDSKTVSCATSDTAASTLPTRR